MTIPSDKTDHQSFAGGLFAFCAFLIWGLSPIYWKALHGVGAFEIILHRVLWSFFFLMPLVFLNHQWSVFRDALKNPQLLVTLLTTSILVGGNWLLYVWAIKNGRVLEASLGYYINPLVNIFLGMLFLRERLRRAQAIAVIIAALGFYSKPCNSVYSHGYHWHWRSVSVFTDWSAKQPQSVHWSVLPRKPYY